MPKPIQNEAPTNLNQTASPTNPCGSIQHTVSPQGSLSISNILASPLESLTNHKVATVSPTAAEAPTGLTHENLILFLDYINAILI